MVEVRDLTKNYGKFTALQNVTFSVGKGQVIGLLGPNGAGKTTTMKILTTFMPQCAGSAVIGGNDTRVNPMEVRRMVGYLPESNPLNLEVTVLEALHFVAKIRGIAPKERSKAVAKIVDMCRLQSVQKKVIGQLSKGFRQRVGLAQAMIHDPQVLVLDEPTSGLDPNQIADMLNLIKELGRDKTVIHSTHILAEAEDTCDRVLILSRGVLVADSHPAKLARNAQGHQMVLRIENSNPEMAQKLSTLDWVQNTEQYGDLWHLYSSEKRDMGKELAEFCRVQNWLVSELAYKEPNLEQVFAHLTRRGDAQ
ncbi:MAG: ATP-binding cassette domain-containing protein [Fibrobacter sp.]|nr:ATP-binding cassette domain-containing protein [Fibrobacter sp.]